MRILHLNHFSSRSGGVESYIADVADALQTDGHASHLVAFTPGDPIELIPATTQVALPDWPTPIDAAAQVISDVIAHFKPDVAYVHAVYHPQLVEWIAQRLPTVSYIHGPYPVCPGSSQYLRQHSRVCPHSAGVICLFNAQLEKCCWGRNPLKHVQSLSRVTAFRRAHEQVKTLVVGTRFMQRLLERGRVPSEKIRILSPVLVHEPLPPVTPFNRSRIILYAGRLTAEKGLRHLIEALAMVTTEWRLVVAGDGPERERCRALAQRLGIAEKMQFVGWLNDAAMSAMFQVCTLVAFPSLWPEPFGRIGPEAYLHGKPVVAYATGGIPEWLHHGVTGYLVGPGNTTELGQRIQALLESPALLTQMGREARRIAESTWTARVHIEQLLTIFEEATTS